MFKIDGNNIYLTRGDTAEFKPIIESYEVQEGDEVVFAVKRYEAQENPDIRIAVAAGDSIEFAHSTTINLTTGTYLYDLIFETVDGDVSTFASGRFILGETMNGNN